MQSPGAVLLNGQPAWKLLPCARAIFDRTPCCAPDSAVAAAVGAFATVPALSIAAGDRLVLLADPQNAAAGFFVAAVTAVESVTAEGMYVPAIESPYIVADGVVMPL